MQVPTTLEQIASTRADKTLDIARFYERTGQPGAARYYYRATTRRWPNTPAAAEARNNLAKLGEGDELVQIESGLPATTTAPADDIAAPPEK
jgi:hypothetical protein